MDIREAWKVAKVEVVMAAIWGVASTGLVTASFVSSDPAWKFAFAVGSLLSLMWGTKESLQAKEKVEDGRQAARLLHFNHG